jgi:predicted RNA-binding protein associated with RNAse of E/G family
MTIVYRRLPDDVREFPGVLRRATESKLIIESPISVDRPVKVDGQIIADAGYRAIWFVYKNRWYDVGKFYDQAERWIGYYCDILKPVKRLLATRSRTVTFTDLFLDLWISNDGRALVLDQKELDSALEKHYISANLAREAKRHIRSLMQRVNSGGFPSEEVRAIQPASEESVSFEPISISDSHLDQPTRVRFGYGVR